MTSMADVIEGNTCYACRQNDHWTYACPDDQAYDKYTKERPRHHAEQRQKARELKGRVADKDSHDTTNADTLTDENCKPKHNGMANNYPDKQSNRLRQNRIEQGHILY